MSVEAEKNPHNLMPIMRSKGKVAVKAAFLSCYGFKIKRMKLILNGNTIDVESETLSGVLQSQGLLEKKGIAVAVNQSVVQKVNWQEFKLKENDNIMIITATQGG